MIFNINNSQKNFTLLVVGVYLFSITIWYLISSASPFMLLFENGLDVILQTIIKSENNERIESLVTSLDDNFFRIALGFYSFIYVYFIN